MAQLLRSRNLVLDANGQCTDHQAGAVLMLDTLSAGPSIDVTWLDAAGNDAGLVAGVLIGRKLHAGGTFAGYRLKGAAGAVVGLLIGPDTSDMLNTLTTSVVIGHVIVDNEIEIKNDAGNPLPATLTLAGALTDVAPVAATDVRVALLAASGTRRSFRVRNAGPDPVAIGGGAVTFADAVIVLQSGDVWIEDDAPGAAWSAICAAGKTASLKVLTAA
jgi:hypothetical protein